MKRLLLLLLLCHSPALAALQFGHEASAGLLAEVKACREFRGVAVERFDLYEQALDSLEEQAAIDGERIKGLEADKGAMKASLTDFGLVVDDMADQLETFKESLVISAEALERCERSKPSRTTWAAIGAAAGLFLGIVAGGLGGR